MDGFLFIDKAKGESSFKSVVKARKIFGEKKVGFAGTLDPLATGLMILAINNYTKLIPFLEKTSKEYEVTLEFGKTSDTYDCEGIITKIEKSKNFSKIITLKVLKNLISNNFSGIVSQTPPIFSAVKVDGQRAYKLARKGLFPKIKERKVQIFSCDILSYEFPFLSLKIKCSAGTYIRTFAHDLGQKLGCGAMVRDLRRTAIGSFSVKSAVEMSQLKDSDLNSVLLPVTQVFFDSNFFDFPILFQKQLLNGQFVSKNNALKYLNFRENNKIRLSKHFFPNEDCVSFDIDNIEKDSIEKPSFAFCDGELFALLESCGKEGDYWKMKRSLKS